METMDRISGILIPLIPITAIITGGIVLILFFKWFFEYKKLLVENQMYRPFSLKEYRSLVLLTGIISLSTGIPLSFIFLWLYGISLASLGGLVPLFVGIGLIIFYTLTLPKN